MLLEQQKNEQRRKEAFKDSSLFSSTEIEAKLANSGPSKPPKENRPVPQYDVEQQHRTGNEQFKIDEPFPDAFRSGVNVEELAKGLDELKQFVDSGMSFGEVPQVK